MKTHLRFKLLYDAHSKYSSGKLFLIRNLVLQANKLLKNKLHDNPKFAFQNKRRFASECIIYCCDSYLQFYERKRTRRRTTQRFTSGTQILNIALRQILCMRQQFQLTSLNILVRPNQEHALVMNIRLIAWGYAFSSCRFIYKCVFSN